jgi:hypothetical protein
MTGIMSEGWRRGWDSNPRAPYGTRRFRGAPVTTTSVPLRSCVCGRSAPEGGHCVLIARGRVNESLYQPQTSVLRRALDAVDDEELTGTTSRLESKAQLLAQRREYRAHRYRELRSHDASIRPQCLDRM